MRLTYEEKERTSNKERMIETEIKGLPRLALNNSRLASTSTHPLYTLTQKKDTERERERYIEQNKDKIKN